MRSRPLRVVGRFGLQLLLGLGRIVGSIAGVFLIYAFWGYLVYLIGKLGTFVGGLTPWAEKFHAKSPTLQSTADVALGVMLVLGAVLLFGAGVGIYGLVIYVKESWQKAVSATQPTNST